MKYYYITYHDSITGVYKTQVIDVVYMYRHHNIEIKLIALISIRNFWRNYKKIKKQLPDALVLPSFPGQKYWKFNKFILKVLISNNDNILIARGVVATNLCLMLKSKFLKIIYDGRGAVVPELIEYGLNTNEKIKNQMRILEHNAVIHSDFRIAISNKLVQFWEKEYKYSKSMEVVIPCSLGIEEDKKCNKQEIMIDGISKEDIIFVYAGSIASWQSFDYLISSLRNILDTNALAKILFLSQSQIEIEALIEEYSDRVFRRWINHEEVNQYLEFCDYGLLLREESVTNSVASPVKFAEYLNAGLQILISPNIGDYSSFVDEHQCGVIFEKNLHLELNKTSESQRSKNKEFAKKYFSKSSSLITEAYLKAIEVRTGL